MSQDCPTAYAELADVIDALPLLLREARRARGLSLRAAAREMDVNFSTITRLEHGGGDLRSDNLTAVLRWLDQTAARRDDATRGNDD